MHTCDKFKGGIREVFISGRFFKNVRNILRLFIHFREISLFHKKVVCFRRNLRAHISGSLPDDQEGFTCMNVSVIPAKA